MFVNRARLFLLSGVAFAASAGSAQAQIATRARTEVSNTAQVSYTVNGTPQSTSSTTAKFVVNREVNLTVTLDQPGAIQVTWDSRTPM